MVEEMMSGMWVEKYRPAQLADIVNQKEIVGSLQALIRDPTEMPHLLFSGSAGVGKTTTALCVTRQILGDNAGGYTLELNASDERGIGMVREKVKKFSRFAGMADVPFKIIILDEADEMTSDAQTALRRIIEDAAKICRFILIANNVSRIIEPIQSRCARFKFTQVTGDDVVGRLAEIAKNEGVKADEDGLRAIYECTEGDLRRAINLLQAVASAGGITRESVMSSTGLVMTDEVGRILKATLSGNLPDARDGMIRLIKVYGMSESDFLKYFNSAVFGAQKQDQGMLSDILRIVAEYDYRVLRGANPEIQLSAMLAEIAGIGKRGS